MLKRIRKVLSLLSQSREFELKNSEDIFDVYGNDTVGRFHICVKKLHFSKLRISGAIYSAEVIIQTILCYEFSRLAQPWHNRGT